MAGDLFAIDSTINCNGIVPEKQRSKEMHKYGRLTRKFQTIEEVYKGEKEEGISLSGTFLTTETVHNEEKSAVFRNILFKIETTIFHSVLNFKQHKQYKRPVSFIYLQWRKRK